MRMASCFVCRGRGHIKLHDSSPSIPCVACRGCGTLRELVSKVSLRITVDRVTDEGNKALDYSVCYDEAVCFRGTVKDSQVCRDLRIPPRTREQLNQLLQLEWAQWSEQRELTERQVQPSLSETVPADFAS